jgi:hypothetical protein
MPILYLIFGHLVADFVLQPFKLVRWKFRSRQGIFLHSLIHLLVYLAIFLPYLPNLTVVLSLLAVAGAHYVIDSLKIDTEKRGSRFHLYFFADQLVHLVTLLAGGWIMTGSTPMPFYGDGFIAVYSNFFLIAGLIMLVFFTYAVEMYRYQFKREKKDGETFKPDYRAMLKRAIVFSVIYAVLMVFAVYKVAAWV